MQSLPQESQASTPSGQGSQAEPKLPVSVGAAQSFIEGEFGGPTTEQDYEFSIGTTVKKIVGNDPDALALTIMNLGSNPVYLMFDDLVSSTRGIQLNSSGGGVSMNVRDDQTLPTRAWWAIAGSSTTDIIVIRTRRFTTTTPGG